jgi:hypothetical protein
MHGFKELAPGKKSSVEIPPVIRAAMSARGIHNFTQLAVACGWTQSGRMKARRMFCKAEKTHQFLAGYIELAQMFDWTLSEFSRCITKQSRSRAEEKLKERGQELYGHFNTPNIPHARRTFLYAFFRGETDLQPLREYQLIADVIGLDIDSLASALLAIDIRCKGLTPVDKPVTLNDVERHISPIYQVA